MRQKEIVYLSFGAPANAIATHFWNEQQAYFDYAPDAPPPVVEHDVSFRAGIGDDGYETYVPRTLLFDVRSEFGSLRRANVLYGAMEEDETRRAWTGEVIHTQDAAAAPTGRAEPPDDNKVPRLPATPAGRYWSDYTQTLFHPRSLVHVSAPSLHGTTFLGTSDAPGSAFDTYEKGVHVAEVMEREKQIVDEELRWFAEDSDLLQGFMLTASASNAFAGVAASYATWICVEYPKSERWAFSVAHAVSSAVPERAARVAAMNDVLALAQLGDAATMLVPLRFGGATSPQVHVAWDDVHQASALLSTHIETATLSTRLRERTESLASLASRLNWRRDTRVAQLGGCFPTPLLADVRTAPDAVDAWIDAMFASRQRSRPLGLRMQPDASATSAADSGTRGAKTLAQSWCDYSRAYCATFGSVSEAAAKSPYAECFVARDDDAQAKVPTLDAIAHWNTSGAPFMQAYVRASPTYSREFAPVAYRVEDAYPQFFDGVTRDGRALPEITGQARPVASAPVVTSLRTSPDTLETLLGARAFVVDVLTGHTPLAAYGVGAPELDGHLDRDALVDIRETLETWCEAYGGVPEDDAQPGTDEEWEDNDAWDVD